ncbi:MAG: EamA family transporter [Calditrichaeota bacterium]|nr:EamA family transporter [Calditrichota bacterium]
MPQHSLRFLFAGFSSYVIWGFLPVLLRLIDRYDGFTIVLHRTITAMILLLLVTITFLRKLCRSDLRRFLESTKKAKTIILTVIGSILLVSNWLVYIYVVNKISINAAAFSYFVLPITTAFLAFLILKEQLNRLKIAGILLSSISCVLLANIGLSEVIFVITTTLTYSLYLISQRQNTALHRMTSLLIQLFLASIWMLIFNPNPYQPFSLGPDFWWVITVISLFFTLLPLFLNLYALNGLESAQLSFLVYVSPITSFLIAISFYNEKLSPLTGIAYLLLIVAILCFNWDLLKFIVTRLKKRLA